MQNQRFYFTNQDSVERLINRWDILLLILLFGLIFFLGYAASKMATPYAVGEPLYISLDIKALPFYSIRTVLRMFIALAISLLFSLVVGALAAKNRRAEQIIIPAIDILQSVPVLSFLAISVTGFIQLFPNSLLGPECASIFVIFISQVWNITFAFYQSLKTLPADLCEAASVFQLSAWQRFWKVEVPFSMSSLLWNMMMSMSGSWFMVVLSESISVAHQDIKLPGIGSYIAVAIEQGSLISVGYAILAMIIVIFLYDQIFFRPLIAWSEKFKSEDTSEDEAYQSWLVDWMRGSSLLKHMAWHFVYIKEAFINFTWFNRRRSLPILLEQNAQKETRTDKIINTLVMILTVTSGLIFAYYIINKVGMMELIHVFWLGVFTSARVIILILVCSIVWVPIGVWIGLRPSISRKAQPIVQFIAAFPANLFYPLFVIAIVKYHLNVEIWLTPLMILGTQWCILFNIIAGASEIPRDLYLAASNYGLKGLVWWKRLALPAIFPYYITGAISAAGGAWNASIVAEYVSWGETTLHATGLGEYIQANTLAGDFTKIALGTAMMCCFVLIFNHVIWQPLYRLSNERFNQS